MQRRALQEINVACRCARRYEIVPLDDIMLRKIKRATDTLNVIARGWVCLRNTQRVKEITEAADESDLILDDILLSDPPKETTAPALKALKRGITVKILL